MTDGGDNNARDERGRFAKGNPGGPGGPRRRACELRLAAEEAITPEHLGAMVRKATRMGLEGNLAAMRFVFDRTIGRPLDASVDAEPLGISLPRLTAAKDCNEAVDRLIDGICQGTVDRGAAMLLISAIQTRLRAIEVDELEERLTQLEQTAEHAGGRRR